MTQNNRIVILTEVFDQAALAKLSQELADAGVRNLDTRHAEYKVLGGEYDGDLKKLEALENVAVVEWDRPVRIAPDNPRIPQ